MSGDKQEPKAGESNAGKKPGKRLTDIRAPIKPAEGLLTFDAEGHEGGKYATRYPHVPTDASGVTLGRGYDMRMKNGWEIKSDLVKAGVAAADAEKFVGAAGLSGNDAREFLDEGELNDFSLTPQQQATLFEISYHSQTAEAKRLCTKQDVEVKYGKCDWDNLHPAIRETVIDLKFRGDYTPAARQLLQKHIADNNLEEFKKVMENPDNWRNVPKDRFDRRVHFLKDAKPVPPGTPHVL